MFRVFVLGVSLFGSIARAVFLAVLAAAGSTTASAQPAQTMRVHFIDVGQGHASLLEFPCAAVLIDLGGEENADFHGSVELMEYLNGFFARRTDLGSRLDAVFLTHPHIDHDRAWREVTTAFRPRNVVTNGQSGAGLGRAQQRSLHNFALGPDGTVGTTDDVPLEFVTLEEQPADLSGFSNAIIDPVRCSDAVDPRLTVLWGQITTRPTDWSQTEFDQENNHSVALRLDFGEASALWIGDMEDTAQEQFVARYQGTNRLDVDVYQVGHHGSRNGSSVGLLQAMSPEIAVIPMGSIDRDFGFTAFAHGHPHEIAIGRLESSVSGTRVPITVDVGKGSRRFRTATISRAIFGTGWDGDVVLETTLQGPWRVVSPSAVPRLKINTATLTQLLSLPGIGQTRANAILTFRAQHGSFASLSELDLVPGIGATTLVVIEPLISFEL